jgi:hypothetical protein
MDLSGNVAFAIHNKCHFILLAIMFFFFNFKGLLCYSLSIIYVVFAFANWLAPAIVSVLGAKVSMIVGASLYV